MKIGDVVERIDNNWGSLKVGDLYIIAGLAGESIQLKTYDSKQTIIPGYYDKTKFVIAVTSNATSQTLTRADIYALIREGWNKGHTNIYIKEEDILEKFLKNKKQL